MSGNEVLDHIKKCRLGMERRPPGRLLRCHWHYGASIGGIKEVKCTSPYGVEIEVGQVWERSERKCTVMLVTGSIRPLRLPGAVGASFWASTRNSTNKRAECCLVKDESAK